MKWTKIINVVKRMDFVGQWQNVAKWLEIVGMDFLLSIPLIYHQKQKSSISLRGVLYKMKSKDPGLALNFCPFCGERLDWFRDN